MQLLKKVTNIFETKIQLLFDKIEEEKKIRENQIKGLEEKMKEYDESNKKILNEILLLLNNKDNKEDNLNNKNENNVNKIISELSLTEEESNKVSNSINKLHNTINNFVIEQSKNNKIISSNINLLENTFEKCNENITNEFTNFDKNINVENDKGNNENETTEINNENNKNNEDNVSKLKEYLPQKSETQIRNALLDSNGNFDDAFSMLVNFEE